MKQITNPAPKSNHQASPEYRTNKGNRVYSHAAINL